MKNTHYGRWGEKRSPCVTERVYDLCRATEARAIWREMSELKRRGTTQQQRPCVKQGGERPPLGTPREELAQAGGVWERSKVDRSMNPRGVKDGVGVGVSFFISGHPILFS